jgi:thioredoxin 1
MVFAIAAAPAGLAAGCASQEPRMASANIKEFTDANFEQEVLQSDQPVLVDFWAEWCMPCRMLSPTIEQIADDFAGKAKVGKVDTDANRNTAFKYNISAIPTVILFKGGEVKKKFVGLTSKDELARAMNEVGGA